MLWFCSNISIVDIEQINVHWEKALVASLLYLVLVVMRSIIFRFGKSRDFLKYYGLLFFANFWTTLFSKWTQSQASCQNKQPLWKLTTRRFTQLLQKNAKNSVRPSWVMLRDCRQNSLLLQNEFERVNQLLLPIKLTENHTFSGDFRRNES